MNGLSNIATKPVGVGIRLVTVRPRVAMLVLVPVIVAAFTSVAVRRLAAEGVEEWR